MRSHIQFKPEILQRAGVVYLYNDRGAATFAEMFATAAEVASLLQISRSSAYRIMQQLPLYDLQDHRKTGEIHCYIVVKRSELEALQRPARGNPHFADSEYQQGLAKRPRKKKLDT